MHDDVDDQSRYTIRRMHRLCHSYARVGLSADGLVHDGYDPALATSYESK